MATPNSCDPNMVENFTVGRYDYGLIFFPGKTDVHDLNLEFKVATVMFTIYVQLIKDVLLFICP